MKKIPKQEYTAEFRELAVKRVKDGLTPMRFMDDWFTAQQQEKLVA